MSDENVLQFACEDVGKEVPYFTYLPHNETINHHLYSVMESLNRENDVYFGNDKQKTLKGINNLPNGAFTIR